MIDFLLSPLTWLLLALLVVWRARQRRGLRRGALAVAALALVLITPLGANLLVLAVESRLTRDTHCQGDMPTTYVILAGGFEHRPRGDHDLAALSGSTLRRTLIGSMDFERAGATRLVLTGGGWFGVSEASLMAQLAEQLGIPADAIELEQSSRTTWQSAFELVDHLPALPHRFVLVSSALHLPRALVAFRAAGFAPCSLATDSRYSPPGGIGYLLPHASSLAKSEAALHEIVGQLSYRLRALWGARAR